MEMTTLANKIIELEKRIENQFLNNERKSEIDNQLEGIKITCDILNITEKVIQTIEEIRGV